MKFSAFIFLGIVYFLLNSCQTNSYKIPEDQYEVSDSTINRYTYNSKGVVDTTFENYSSYFEGQLSGHWDKIRISRYDSNDQLILEQEYEKNKEDFKLTGERQLKYNKKNQLIDDRNIFDGKMLMETRIEYNEFDSISKISHISDLPTGNLEEDAKNIKYDTTTVNYAYNNLKQRIAPEFISDKPKEIIKISSGEKIEVSNNPELHVIDSTWYMDNVKIRSTNISEYNGTTRKTCIFFNSHGDPVRTISYKKVIN